MATGTIIEVVMPQMGVSVSEGTIVKWLKNEGEAIEADETLLEISTDKVDTEIPSPGSGVLQEILVPEGETVDVGTLLATIAAEGAVGASPPPPPPPAAAAEPEPEPEPELQPEQAQASDNGKTFVSPVVARIAAEHGVDPDTVAGTGRGGRVTKKDILSHLEAEPEAAAAPTAPAPAPPAAAPPPPAPAVPPAPPSPT
jgi:pyruvate/2-oxoglutarate dehydrogenase complex dihydrolipoamide acyltransferase (E2) component